MKFYGICTDAKGNNKIIDNLSDIRVEALNDARLHCKKNGFNFEGIYLIKGKEFAGSPTSKTLFKRIAAEINKK
jgi:hypothetical protein